MTVFGLACRMMPRLTRDWMAKAHFWLHQAGVLVFVIFLWLLLSERMAGSVAGPILGLAEAAVIIGALIWLWNLLRTPDDRALPVQPLDHPVQPHVEAACGGRVSVAQFHAGTPGDAAGAVHLACAGQFVQRFQQQRREPGLGRGRGAYYHPSPSGMPKCALAIEVIISGPQRGSCVSSTSAVSIPSAESAASREPLIR